jgi:hypothetical protein
MTEDVFDNREDAIRTLNRLVGRQLIEANTKSTESIVGASHVRVTSAGWYYSEYLVKAFSYIDLVLQDTPLNDAATERELRLYVQQVDNLGDRQEEKLARMQVRFARVRNFMEYLRREEENEEVQFNLSNRGGIWAQPFVPGIRDQIEIEIGWIERRLKENRERFAEDIQWPVAQGDEPQGLGDDEDASDAPVSGDGPYSLGNATS